MTGLRPLSLLALPPVLAVCAGLFPAPAHGAALDTPSDPVAETMTDSTEAMDAFRAKQEAVVEAVRAGASDAELQAKVDELLDYEWLATAALGGPKHYAKVCGERCGEFQGLLTQLIRANYLRMIRKAEKHPIEYVGQVAGRNGMFKVTTRLEIEKHGRRQTVTVAYTMRQTEGAWRVLDIITDDVSLARTYSYEFRKIVEKEGIAGVITRLEAKLDALD
ncbi:hypothetical protein PPSIR1_18045 [Plesiocystis pacifica SIR-1]|uniref:Uncharacterized protein n=1 Tax=Plesiocystis pacifica SIR-1 TaxID=391625 RepID=A6GFU9_9BACT|nr:ABC transporter substrate-binding protein [Plesiocystis pacifica]EDM75247.1 hypothetical protein PPSIR1_18045 [Plesiocystis pacifica SIR-1]